jgi:hypothetical protein
LLHPHEFVPQLLQGVLQQLPVATGSGVDVPDGDDGIGAVPGGGGGASSATTVVYDVGTTPDDCEYRTSGGATE